MDFNLLRVVKRRLMWELREAVEKHTIYRDKVEVYHKFPYKERPNMGVVLKNASSNRQKLSPDDFAGTLKSHLALAHAENKAGRFLEWVWEDEEHNTVYIVDEDVSSQITGTATVGTNRAFYTANKPVISGDGNTKIADNIGQIRVTKNGVRELVDFIDGKRGLFFLSNPPVVGDVIKVSYYISNMTLPGRYYIELINDTQYVIDPLYQIKREEVIVRTSGVELTASLDHPPFSDFDVLYTIKRNNDYTITLEKGTDYTLDAAGLITFLQPLPVDNTLYADYRWVGAEMGPFTIPEDFEYDNQALIGVTLAFGNERVVGDKVVLIVYPERQTAAQVFSGHFNMNFEIEVFTRDPMQLSDLTDQILSEVWNNRRLPLIDEGLTILEMDPTGEVEEPYDNNTGDLYYKNSINLQMMTEWKKFVPYLTEILDINVTLHESIKEHEVLITNQNKMLELRLVPNSQPFEIKYPKSAHPRYF